MADLSRRRSLQLLAAGAASAAACAPAEPKLAPRPEPPAGPAVVGSADLAFPWPTRDPFLFCVHHDDAYPEGDERLGPKASLEGRSIGRDFTLKDGWRMYHGRRVPGFPRHPHRGFETVTVVRRGLLDHSDSMGAQARYGDGDVQWLTTGRGIQHAEMFPLLRGDARNPVDFFQIWLNLPAADKMVEPHFAMLWADGIPVHELSDEAGRGVRLVTVAGAWGGGRPPAPPPASWASRPESDLAIWTLSLEPGARFTLPAVRAGTERSLYWYAGRSLRVGGEPLPGHQRADLLPEAPVELEAGETAVEALLLQGRPIGEPVARRGPFVMNTPEEIRRAYADYQETGFGGWPWPDPEPVHGRRGRFARHADGKLERPA